MQRYRYRYRSNVGGLIAFVMIILGVIFFLAFYTDLFRITFWPLPSIGILIVILIVIGILNSGRRRTRQRTYPQQAYKRYEPYKPTENPFWKKEENVVVETQKFEKRTVNEIFFCDFCGMKVTEEMKFCTNCGNNLH